jgi:hypothetical protein
MTKRQVAPKKARPNAFTKGTPRPPNSGRAKGTRNKRTALLKDAILKAATLVGQDGKGKDGLVGYLKMLAIKERAVYSRLLEKVLPMQVHVADDAVTKYTAEEAAQRLRERGLPVPPSLIQLSSTSIAYRLTGEEDYASELEDDEESAVD